MAGTVIKIVVRDGMVTDVFSTNENTFVEVLDFDVQSTEEQDLLEKQIKDLIEDVDCGTMYNVW